MAGRLHHLARMVGRALVKMVSRRQVVRMVGRRLVVRMVGRRLEVRMVSRRLVVRRYRRLVEVSGSGTGWAWPPPFRNLHSCRAACTARVRRSGTSPPSGSSCTATSG